MNCENCNKKALPETVSRYAYEETVARMDIHNNRLFRLVVILAIVAALEFCGLLSCFIYETQFEDVSVSQDIDTGDGDAVVAGAGDVYYGEDKTDG